MNVPDFGSESATGRAVTRAGVQRELQRTTTSVIVLLLVVLALAAAAVFAGMQAAGQRERAEAAEAQARDRLWHSLVAQARAVRLTPEAGRRAAVLTVLSNAAAIRVSPVLRTEAIAALALTDIQTEGPLRPFRPGMTQVEMDAGLERFAYGDAAGRVHVCSLEDGRTLRTLSAPELGAGTRLGVRSVAFSPDGRKLAARHEGGALLVWDLESGGVLLESGVALTNVVVAGMSFWPDRDVISYGDGEAGGQIVVHDFSTGARQGPAIRVGARTFRFRPGTLEVAVTTDRRVDVSDYPQENRRLTFEAPTRVFTHAWSPDGRQLAVATEDGDVHLWTPGSDRRQVLRGHTEPCVRLAFSPDGSLLASGSRDGTTRLWDLALAQTVVVSSEGIAHGFSWDGGRLGFWRPSVGFGTWRLDRSDTYRQLVCPSADGALLSVDLAPSGRWCVATQARGVRVWDLGSPDVEIFIPVGDVAGVRIAPGEAALWVCRGAGLEHWSLGTNAAGGIELGHVTPRRIALPDGRGARGIAVSLEGRRAVVELTDGRLVVLHLEDAATPVVLDERVRVASARSPGSPTGAGRFAISPDGRWVATGFGIGPDDRPRVWDADTGAVAAVLPMESSVVVFSPDGRWLGTAGVASFAVWSVGDWGQISRQPRDEPGITHGSMAFVRGGSEVVVTRSRQQAQWREAFSEERFADFIPPQAQSVNSLRLALEGSVLVTASATDKLQVWRLGAIRQTLVGLGLGPRQTGQAAVAGPAAAPGRSRLTQWVLLGSTMGFALAAAFGLFTLGRHRAALSGFLAAEARAEARHRELEVAKLELMHSQKMQALGTLAAGIAHDFNNLLSVIRMSGRLIARAAPTVPEVLEQAADIEQAVLQGKGVVASMLGYARADEGGAGPTDVCGVVENTVSLLSREFLSGLTLKLALDRHAPPVEVSRGRLEQVLLNLVVNASEAMQGQGTLRITVQMRGAAPPHLQVLRPGPAPRYVELAVSDSGPGVPPEVRDRLFEPFFTTKRSGAQAGTGLGLSLVYAVAQQEALGLGVDSAPGRGATFTLLIPVRQTHSAEPPATA